MIYTVGKTSKGWDQEKPYHAIIVYGLSKNYFWQYYVCTFVIYEPFQFDVHASTCTTSSMFVKNRTCYICLWHLCGTLKRRKLMKEQKHQIQ